MSAPHCADSTMIAPAYARHKSIRRRLESVRQLSLPLCMMNLRRIKKATIRLARLNRPFYVEGGRRQTSPETAMDIKQNKSKVLLAAFILTLSACAMMERGAALNGASEVPPNASSASGQNNLAIGADQGRRRQFHRATQRQADRRAIRQLSGRQLVCQCA